MSGKKIIEGLNEAIAFMKGDKSMGRIIERRSHPMKTPKLKTKSAVTGKYTKAKGADPKTTYQSDDYPARQLRKLIRLLENNHVSWVDEIAPLIANIKKRMGWK